MNTCTRCNKPLQRASLRARDVASIIDRFYRSSRTQDLTARRCPRCKTIWIGRKGRITTRTTIGDLNVKTRKRYTAGEIRFRTAPTDQRRIDWLLDNHPDQCSTVSSLLRILILREYERLQPRVKEI